MRKLLLLFFAAACRLPAPAAIVWDETEHHFGTLEEADGIVSHRFSFVNSGNDSVTIKQIRTSCGCTTADYPKSPVAPGDSACLTVSYDPEMRPGQFDRSISVITDEGKYRLRIVGAVKPTEETVAILFPEKSGCLRFRHHTAGIGNVRQGQQSTSGIIGHNDGEDTLRLSPGNLPDCLNATIAPATVAPGENFRVNVTFSARKNEETGLKEWQLPILDREKEIGRLNVTARVMPERITPENRKDFPVISVRTKRIDLTPLRRTEKRTVEIPVENLGKTALHISDVYTVGEESIRTERFDKEIKPEKQGIIRLSVDPSATKSDVLNGLIVAVSDDPVTTSLKIRLVGQITEE